MTPKNCATCGSSLKLIPAGTSKTTGRPYQEFWSCPNRCKQPSFRQFTPGNTSSTSNAENIRAMKDETVELLKQILDLLKRHVGEDEDPTIKF